MISGTEFLIVNWADHADEIASLLAGRLAVNLDEIQAECGQDDTLLLRSDDGFIVAQMRAQGDGLDLFLRLGVGSKPGAFRRAEPAIVAIAQELGARTITFGPGRAGWKRLLGGHWRPKGDEFMRYVDGCQTEGR